jgi:mannose-6-phosphate isomerase-like protein (cupin superfamily)
MHLYVERSKLKATVPWGYDKHSQGYQRTTLVDHTLGSVHQGTGICELEPGGSVDACVHANEEGIYVFEGELEMRRGSEAFRLSMDDYALVPYGVPHAYRNRGNKVVRWFEVLAPQPKPPGVWQDTFFLRDADWPKEMIKPDLADPRTRLLGHFTEVGVYSGIRTRGLTTYKFMNRNFGAQLFLLMRGELAPGGTLGPHDHPIEECYYSLSGELEFEMEGKIYQLRPGDMTWTGVGARHTWRNKGNVPYRWIETHVPELPEQYGIRDLADWDKLRNLQDG